MWSNCIQTTGRLDMRTKGLALGAGSSALLLCLLATTSPAQDKTRQRATIVRVYSNEGTGVVSNYVTPSIQVSEDAYVFAVMMDLDGHIQVLQPDFRGSQYDFEPISSCASQLLRWIQCPAVRDGRLQRLRQSGE